MRETEHREFPLSCALLGFGTVGSAVARRLTAPESGAPSNIQLTHIFDRRAAEKRASAAAAATSPGRSSIDEVLHSGADIVVEAIGGVEPAAEWIRAALLAGKSVVTANKQVIARHGAALLTLAARQGRQLRFEAAVGGAMPIVRAIGEGLAGDRITRMVAILNGTTNAVLSQMEATGCDARRRGSRRARRGYAEADPSADLDGDDARAKLAILCALAFGLRVDPVADRRPIVARRSARPTSRGRGSAARRSARSPSPTTTARRPLLTAWVAPVEVDVRLDLRREPPGRRTRR